MSPLAYLSLGLFACLLVGGVQVQACSSGCMDYDNRCYCLVSDQLTWTQAQAQCSRRGSNLAALDFNLVPDAIANYLVSRMVYEDVWIQPTFTRARVCLALDKDTGFMKTKKVPCNSRLKFLCQKTQ